MRIRYGELTSRVNQGLAALSLRAWLGRAEIWPGCLPATWASSLWAEVSRWLSPFPFSISPFSISLYTAKRQDDNRSSIHTIQYRYSVCSVYSVYSVYLASLPFMHRARSDSLNNAMLTNYKQYGQLEQYEQPRSHPPAQIPNTVDWKSANLRISCSSSRCRATWSAALESPFAAERRCPKTAGSLTFWWPESPTSPEIKTQLG